MKLTRLQNRTFVLTLCAVVYMLAVGSGCAYYNTFYNIKKEFRAAEKQTQRALAGATVPMTPGQPNQQMDRPSQILGPIQEYQAIIQSCGKLLEFYPNSRWVDDALMVMGISYFRVQEFSRAERKFTELVTIFPKSKHAEMAIVWRARSLVAQNKLDEAERVLLGDQAKLASPGARAASFRTLAEVSELRKQPLDAISYLEQIRDISYSKDEKATDFLRLGRSYVLLKRYDEAKVALKRCLDLTRVSAEAFQARKILADLAAEQNNYLEAKNYLLPMRVDRRFIEQAGEVEVELARVEAHAGDPAVAIQMLEEYCANSTAGESKARAYYLQGEVARNRLSDFELAKAKFDSVPASGASRALQDSARQASAQLESGLNALSRIPALEDSLQSLMDNPPAPELIEDVADTLTEGKASTGSETDFESQIEDSLQIAESDTSTTEFQKTESLDSTYNSETTAVLDTVERDSISNQTELTIDEIAEQADKELSPAELIADSIMRSITTQDSIRKAERAIADSIKLVAETGGQVVEQVPMTVPKRGPSAQEVYFERLSKMSRKLVSTHLEAASFFELVAMNQDSAIAHLETAVAVPDSSDDHWRSKVQLGIMLLGTEGERSQRGHDLLAEVAESEEAPHSVRNIACKKLGLPELAPVITDQTRSLRRAEQLLLSESGIEDVLSAYRETASMDSLSTEGSQALHAIAYLQEYRTGDFEAARTTHEAIVRLFPDSSFTLKSQAKLASPDSNSVFLLSEDELQASYQPASELLSAESDSTGWPPDIETLRGRRFR